MPYGFRAIGTQLYASRACLKRTGLPGEDRQGTVRPLKNVNLRQNGPRKKTLSGKRNCPAWVTRPRSSGAIKSSSLRPFRSVKGRIRQSLTMHPDLMTMIPSHKCIASLSCAWTESQGKCSGRPHAKSPSLMREDT